MAQGTGQGTSLADCPIELRGDWFGSPTAASAVLTRLRAVALNDLRLRSPQQPDRLIVENHKGYPSIWLHKTPADAAWIMVDMTVAGAWAQLAYQSGHELGHILANSWQAADAPHPPSQWLEETLAEAFSLRALSLLSGSWDKTPVFPGQRPYAAALKEYRANTLSKYRTEADQEGADNLPAWFRQDKPLLDRVNGLYGPSQAVVPAVLGLIDPEPLLVEDYQGMNLWPERTTLPVAEYLAKWEQSCHTIGTPGRLPRLLTDILGVKKASTR